MTQLQQLGEHRCWHEQTLTFILQSTPLFLSRHSPSTSTTLLLSRVRGFLLL